MSLQGSPVPKSALPGCVVRSNGATLNHCSVLPLNAGSAQVARITSQADVEDNANYVGTVSYLDKSISFDVTTDADGTGAELILLIKAALEADPDFGILISSAEIVSSVNLDLTAQDGVTLVVEFSANPTTDLAATYTAAVAPDQFYFGRAVEITNLTIENGVVIETAEGADSSSVSAKFALVLQGGDEVYFEQLGDSEPAVGPTLGVGFVVVKPGAKNWYAVEAPVSAPTYGGAVYVEGAASANKGRLLTSGGGDTVQWTQAKWIGLDPNYPTVAWIEI